MLINLEIKDTVNKGFVDIKKAKGLIARNTLNSIAFLVRKNDINNIKSNFILRNKYTINSIRVDKADGENIESMQSRTYYARKNVEEYMYLHETGGIKKSKKGKKIAMAQLAARNWSGRNLVSKSYYLKKIKKNVFRWPTGKGRTRKSRLVQLAAAASYYSDAYINYKNNIYKISSFTKSKNKVRFKKEHIYNLSQTYAKMPTRKHFEPALKKPVRDAQSIFNSQLRKELRKKNII